MSTAKTFGPPLYAQQLKQFLSHHIENNLRLQKRGNAPVPLCIWGEHGIGKTQIVEAFARENRMKFSYLAPAQYEEMGDLAGLPDLEDGKTVFRPAAWVPRSQGPGILLLDDFNRADERILRGLMQLLQGYGLAGWQLPPKWQIILTANPDHGDYSVTPLDDAMLSRMLHVELQYRLSDWMEWAQKNDIDPRAQRFMQLQQLHLPKGRTTARSLTQFFQSIETIPDWKAAIEQVAHYAHATLEEETADAFLRFVQAEAWQIPSPQEALQGAFRQIPTHTPHPLWAQFVKALIQHINQRPQLLSKSEKTQLIEFITSEQLPKDVHLMMMRLLQKIDRRDINEILNKPEVLRQML